VPADRAEPTASRRGHQPPARRGVRTDDLLAGGTFLVLGAAFVIGGLGYELGTALNMGPGYVPVVLGGLLAVLGLVVAAEGVLARHSDGTGLPDASGEPGLDLHQEKGPVPWRRGGLLVAALVLFALLVDGLGLAPTLLITTFLSALAGRDIRPVKAALIAVGLTVIILVIFVLLLQLRLPLLGDWLGG